MGTHPVLSIVTNVGSSGAHLIDIWLRNSGGEYGHYADEPHCYRCK